MSRVMFISKKRIQWYIAALAIVVLGAAYAGWHRSQAASAPPPSDVQVRYIVTTEFTSKTDSGQQLEAYRWDPGTIPVKKGQPVELRITGVNGESHPFTIEGLGVKATVNKGKTTVVRFTPKEAGTYAIVCETHSDPKDGVPMVGYLVVQ